MFFSPSGAVFKARAPLMLPSSCIPSCYSIFLGVCLWIIYVGVGGVQRSAAGVTPQVPPTLLLLLLFKRVVSFTWNSLSGSHWQAIELQGSSCLCLPSTGVIGVHCHAWLYFCSFPL